MYNSVICRYHEIATKGNNRSRFELCLMDNIRKKISSYGEFKVRRVRGRIWISKKDKSNFENEELENIKNALSKIFGIESFSPAIMIEPEFDVVRQAAIDSAKSILSEELTCSEEKIPFRVRARRSNKRYPMKSVEVEIDLTTAIDNFLGGGKLKVDLRNAKYTLGCEIRDEFALIFWDEFAGAGGLPVNSNPNVLTLLSGGIDSPVAACMLMKRGCRNDFLTFHSSPYTPPETLLKVKKISTIINDYQTSGTLYACNLAPLQKMIRDFCKDKYRTVLYRRAMLKIAEKLAHKIEAKALVTGEAVGQVASQTIVNMNTINSAIDMLVIRPLAGLDKIETIVMAKKIGTMTVSEEQVPDSCTVFAPHSPSTSVPEHISRFEEEKIPEYYEIIEKIFNDIEIIT